MLLAGQASWASAYQVQFSEIFGPFCGGWTCASSVLTALAGTAFSGAFVFPVTGVDTAPNDPSIGVYLFPAPVGSFQFDSVVNAFDVAGPAKVTLRVYNCIGGQCSYSGDLVTLAAEVGGFRFDMSLVNYGPVLDVLTNDEFPALDVLQGLALHPLFSLSSLDYAATVDAEWNSSQSSLAASVAVVPLPATAWLLGTGIVGLFGRRLRRSAV